MSFAEVCYHLTRDPFHYTFDQIRRLTPYQVRRILFQPHDGFREPGVRKGVPAKELAWERARARGEIREAFEEKWAEARRRFREANRLAQEEMRAEVDEYLRRKREEEKGP